MVDPLHGLRQKGIQLHQLEYHCFRDKYRQLLQEFRLVQYHLELYQKELLVHIQKVPFLQEVGIHQVDQLAYHLDLVPGEDSQGH